MSILIDELKKYENTKRKISYITLRGKIKDCIKILRNRAIAVHYKEDEEDKQ